MEPAAVPMKKLKKRAARPEPRRIGCTNCAAPLDIRNGVGAKQTSCSYCGAVIDLTSDKNAVLRILTLKQRPPATLALGDKGKFKGKVWEVIGRLRVEERDEDGVYPWNEYLLFNPTAGYRWLEEDCGHWTFGQKAKRKPLINPKVMRPGTTFAAYNCRFRAGEAVMGHVAFVEGEFPYHTEVGDKSISLPSYSPPHCLTAEWTDNEIEWTISDYVEPKSIGQAFGKDIPDVRKETHGAKPIPPRKTLPGFVPFCMVPLLFIVLSLLANYFLCTKYPDVPIGAYSTSMKQFVTNSEGIEVPTWSTPKFAVPDCSSILVSAHCTPIDKQTVVINWQLQRADGKVVHSFEDRVVYFPKGHVIGGTSFSRRLPIAKGDYKLHFRGTGAPSTGDMTVNVIASIYNGQALAHCGALFGLLTIAFVFIGGLFKSFYEFFANLFS